MRPPLATNVLWAAPVQEMKLVGLTAMRQKLQRSVNALQGTSQLLKVLQLDRSKGGEETLL